MLPFHFAKIDFRFFSTPQKILGTGFCVLPFLDLANTMQRHTSNVVAANGNFHENTGFRQHNAWQWTNQLRMHSKYTRQHIGVDW